MVEEVERLEGEAGAEGPDLERGDLARVHSGRLLLQLEPVGGGVNRSGRREYDCIFLQPGRVMMANGEESTWLIPADVAQAAAPLFGEVSCYLDHPDQVGFWGSRGEPKVRNLAGVTFDAQWSEEDRAVVGGIRLYDKEPGSPGAFVGHLVDQILADKETGLEVPSLGLSAVFYHDSVFDEEAGLRVTTAFRKIESVDFVYAAGARGYVRKALAAMETGEWPRSRYRLGAYPQRSEAMSEEVRTAGGEGSAPPEEEAPRAEHSTQRFQQLSPAVAPVLQQAQAQQERPVDLGAALEAIRGVAERIDRLEGLSASVERLAGQVEVLSRPAAVAAPVADPEPEPVPVPAASATPAGDLVVERLDGLSASVERLAGLMAEREAGQTVTGMGDAPRGDGGRISLGPTGLEQMEAAVDWIFGVPGASLPVPDLRRTDRIYYLLSGDGNWTGVFNEREALATANPTTLPGLAVNAMNKVIVPLYDRMGWYRWYEKIVVVQPTDGTLHDMAWLQFGGIGDLPIVADGAAYTELTVADSKESDSFIKRGGYVGITEKMLRNSAIAEIQAIPKAMVLSSVQTRSGRIAGLFTASAGVGPTLDQDSTALFHNDHGNLATTAYSWSAWKAARIECAKQTELGSSKRQGLFPRYCLVPIDLYDGAMSDFGYGAGPQGQPGTSDYHVNPYAMDHPDDPRPVPLCVPDWTDTNDWGYLADPMVAPIIQMAYADNPGGGIHPPPQLYVVTSKLAGLMFTNDVLPIKVRDYWAYGVATYRGIGKRNVS